MTRTTETPTTCPTCKGTRAVDGQLADDHLTVNYLPCPACTDSGKPSAEQPCAHPVEDIGYACRACESEHAALVASLRRELAEAHKEHARVVDNLHAVSTRKQSQLGEARAERDEARSQLATRDAQLAEARKALERIRDDYGDVWGGSRDGLLACMYCGETTDGQRYADIGHDDDCAVAIAARAWLAATPQDGGTKRCLASRTPGPTGAAHYTPEQIAEAEREGKRLLSLLTETPPSPYLTPPEVPVCGVCGGEGWVITNTGGGQACPKGCKVR